MNVVKLIKEINCILNKSLACGLRGLKTEIEDVVTVVEKWSAEHPKKTMLQDFLEKYPNAPLEDDKTPSICPHSIGYCEDNSFCKGNTCEDCWNRPM